MAGKTLTLNICSTFFLLLKEHFTVFSVQLKQKRSKIFIIYRFFLYLFCLDSDPKQIIPNPDLGKVLDPTRSGFSAQILFKIFLQ